jgi:agmatine deiminase
MNIWCRDFMPLQVGDHFVQFSYKGYGEAKNTYEAFPWLQVPQKCFAPFQPLVKSSIVLDGGGVIREGEWAIMTEKVFEDNPDRKKADLIHQLTKIFEAQIIFIPVEPEDTLGHSDGICKFVNEKTLLINDYSVIYPKSPDHRFYNEKLLAALAKYQWLKIELMPYAYDQCPEMEENEFKEKYPFGDDFNMGTGYYVNFLLTKSCIICPVFGFKQDKKAIDCLKKYYPNHSIVAINCFDLSAEGGLLNCVSWNIKE